jgi:hypothetical protein
MKVMIIGSILDGKKEEFAVTCHNIAKVLLEMKATLIICSLFQDSADYLIYKEFCKTSNNIELHFLNVQSVRERIKDVKVSSKIKLFRYLDDRCKLDSRDAYLFCQINAIKQADMIIAVGGKLNGSANMLLYIAEMNKKPVIPLVMYEGAANNYYQRNKYKISDCLGENKEIVLSDDIGGIIKAFIYRRKVGKMCSK